MPILGLNLYLTSITARVIYFGNYLPSIEMSEVDASLSFKGVPTRTSTI